MRMNAPASQGLPEIKLARLDARTLNDTGLIDGYASIFEITDQTGDVVTTGAFAKSLIARPAGQVRMLWQHDPSEPIGVWEEIAEDARGLRVRGRILEEVARGREVLSLLRAKAVDGLSIGFRTIRSRMDERRGVRLLLEVDLWEISIVTFPMNDAARIAGVKQAGSLREFEAFLREAGGFSRTQAMRIAAHGFPAAHAQRDAEQDLHQLALSIARARNIMQP